MVRTYWLVPGFNEASGNLDLQPFARTDHVEACRPRAMCTSIVRSRVGIPAWPSGNSTRSCSAPGRRARSAPGASPTAGCRWRSSSSTWSAASAPTTPACPRRRCCGPASLLAEARRVPGVAEAVTGELDPQAVLDRRDEVIHDLDDSGQLPWLEERGIELFRGEGALDGERRVRVGDDVLTRAQGGRRRHRQRRRDAADRRPRLGAGLEQPRRDHLEAGAREHGRPRRRPGRLRAGAGLVDARHRGDPDRGRASACSRARSPSPARRSPTALRESHGVDVRTGVQRRASQPRAATASRSSWTTASEVEAAELLVAVGRKPRTEGIGLESVGVEPGEGGFLETDDRLRVGGRDWLYAVGDVNGRALFTHMGKYQAWVAAENVARPRGRGDRRRHRLAAGHLHRPPGRRRRQDARRRPAKPASTPARSTSPPTAPPAPASRARKPAAPRGSSSTRPAR